MLKRLVAIGFAFYCLPILAAPVTLTWNHPTTYSDGLALPLADIASTTVQYSSTNNFAVIAGSVVVNAPAATTTIDRPPGTWYFRAATTTIPARDSRTSAFSMVATKAIPWPAPNPPTIGEIIVAWLRRVFGRFA
jgi:hypothetical protein